MLTINEIRIDGDRFELFADDPLTIPALQAYAVAAEQHGDLVLAQTVKQLVVALIDRHA